MTAAKPSTDSVLETVEFRLPLPPARGNVRDHLAEWRSTRDWQGWALVEMRRQRISWPREPWARARISLTFVMPDTAEDPDNVLARQKTVIDWLKVHWARFDPTARGNRRPLSRPPADPNDRLVFVEKPGFIADDDAEHVELGPVTVVACHPDHGSGVAIKLERLA